MIDTNTVPAGQYAEESLRALGLWERLQPKLIFAENVRQALDYVARGEVDDGRDRAGDVGSLDYRGARLDVAPPARAHAVEQVEELEDDADVVPPMRTLAAQYPRYGYRTIRIFFERQGHVLGEALVPSGTGVGRLYQPGNDQLACFFVGGERR